MCFSLLSNIMTKVFLKDNTHKMSSATVDALRHSFHNVMHYVQQRSQWDSIRSSHNLTLYFI